MLQNDNEAGHQTEMMLTAIKPRPSRVEMMFAALRRRCRAPRSSRRGSSGISDASRPAAQGALVSTGTSISLALGDELPGRASSRKRQASNDARQALSGTRQASS
jgi:hypothetical protein